MSEPAHEGQQQFVYILRDRAGYPLYVGRGAKSTRPQAHLGRRAHNVELSEAILEGSISIDITGPLGSERTAAIVEGALISAFSQIPTARERLKNKDPGASAGRFRPYGVPTKYVERSVLPALNELDLLALAGEYPVIAVLLTKKVLRDGRRTFDMALGATDRDLENQMDRWWPIGRKHRKQWKADPAISPGLLVAMSGSPRHRVCVGALEMDRSSEVWEASANHSARFRIPVRHSAALDFGKLRGRSIDVGAMPESGIKIIQ